MRLNRKILDTLIKGVTQLLGAMITCIIVFIVMQVIWRYGFGKPLLWSEQLCRFIFIWMMMLGIPCLFNRKDFMAFDLLLESIKGVPYHLVRILIDLAIVCFAVFWFKGSTALIAGTFQKMTTGVRIPYYCLYGAQTVSAVLTFWVMVSQLLEQFVAMFKEGKAKKEDKA